MNADCPDRPRSAELNRDRGTRRRQSHPGRPGDGRRLRPCQRAPSHQPDPLSAVEERRSGGGDQGRHHRVRPRQRSGRCQGTALYLERFIHGEIYKARPDVRAVVNAHSPWVLSFAASKIPLRAVHNKAAFLGAGTPIFEIREHSGRPICCSPRRRRPGAGDALGESAVVLLRGHGHVAVGPSLQGRGVPRLLRRVQRPPAGAVDVAAGITIYVEGEEAVKADPTMQRVDQRPGAVEEQGARQNPANRDRDHRNVFVAHAIRRHQLRGHCTEGGHVEHRRDRSCVVQEESGAATSSRHRTRGYSGRAARPGDREAELSPPSSRRVARSCGSR